MQGLKETICSKYTITGQYKQPGIMQEQTIIKVDSLCMYSAGLTLKGPRLLELSVWGPCTDVQSTVYTELTIKTMSMYYNYQT